MNTDKLLKLINDILIEAESYALTHKTGLTSINDIKKVLYLLKEQITSDPERINQRVLRAMHDVGMSSYKEFENSTLEKAINRITEQLYEEIPVYRNLQPLRKDFGKGYPI